ncbi:MAG: hypothetical protein M3Y87_05715 [Myxococcota bacterium]|nr:hypothetical protein [Myxococcota bacterium]
MQRTAKASGRAEASRSLARDARGAVMTEYIVLTATVGIVVALAAAAIGVPLVHAFRFAQAFLVLPIP